MNVVAKRYDLKASTVSDWRRMARMGKLVLPSLDSIEFLQVRIEEAKPPAAVPTPASVTGTLDVNLRLDAGAKPERIAQIAAAL